MALGALVARYNIGLHCCLSPFIVPFLGQAGLAEGENGCYKSIPFDFHVRGVMSISCDTHKVCFISSYHALESGAGGFRRLTDTVQGVRAGVLYAHTVKSSAQGMSPFECD